MCTLGKERAHQEDSRNRLCASGSTRTSTCWVLKSGTSPVQPWSSLDAAQLLRILDRAQRPASSPAPSTSEGHQHCKPQKPRPHRQEATKSASALAGHLAAGRARSTGHQRRRAQPQNPLLGLRDLWGPCLGSRTSHQACSAAASEEASPKRRSWSAAGRDTPWAARHFL